MGGETIARRAAWSTTTPQVACLAAVATLAIVLVRPDFPLDDSYITLHNARALLAGGWDATYGTSALTGATSAVHLMLVAALGLLLPLPVASHLVGLIAVALYAAGLDRMAIRAAVNRAAFVVAGLVPGYTLLHLSNGLETGLGMAAAAWSIVLVDHRRLPLLLGVLPFIRPELALLSGSLLIRRCWLDRAEPSLVAASIGMAVATAAPWLAFYWLATGSPITNTGAAKIAFFAEQRQPLFKKLGVAVIGLVFAVPRLLFGVTGLREVPAGLAIGAFLLLWLGIAVATLPGGLHANGYRYLALAVPPLLYGCAASMRRPSTCRIVLLWSVATSALGIYIVAVGGIAPQMKELRGNASAIPRGAVVMVHDAGYLAWIRPDLHLVDIVGLKTPASAAWHRQFTAPTGDRLRAFVAIAAASRARYLVVLRDDPFFSEPAIDLQRAGWSLRVLVRPKEGYAIYEVRAPTNMLKERS